MNSIKSWSSGWRGGRVRFGREREGLGLGGRGRVRFGRGEGLGLGGGCWQSGWCLHKEARVLYTIKLIIKLATVMLKY